MGLRLRGLARAVAGAVGTCAVGLAVAAVLTALGTPGVATAVDGSPSWEVTVGDASRTLYPGTEATMAYDVRNATPGSLRLHGTTAVVHLNGASSACRAEWFRILSNTAPADADVAPDGTVHGALVVAFENAPVSQDACKNIDLEVVVTAS